MRCQHIYWGDWERRMARIRTIKPDFFNSTDIISVPHPCRLMFLGMLVYADDAGNGNADPVQLKTRIFPADRCGWRRVRRWRDRLTKAGLIKIYQHGGAEYYHMLNFHKHQRINRPTPPQYPPYPDESEAQEKSLNEDSLRTHGGLTEEDRKEKGRKDREGGLQGGRERAKRRRRPRKREVLTFRQMHVLIDKEGLTQDDFEEAGQGGDGELRWRRKRGADNGE